MQLIAYLIHTMTAFSKEFYFFYVRVNSNLAIEFNGLVSNRG